MTSARSNSNRQKSLKLRADRQESDGPETSPNIEFLPDVFISGGQTGVDRAALDFAIEQGLEHGGWCPAGRRAEDGTISLGYQLKETESSDYVFRTEQNVIDSDATLILYDTIIRGGTKLTTRFATRHGRPFLTVDLASPDIDDEVNRLQIWLTDRRPERLNIAGPRASSSPGIYDQALSFLRLLQP